MSVDMVVARNRLIWGSVFGYIYGLLRCCSRLGHSSTVQRSAGPWQNIFSAPMVYLPDAAWRLSFLDLLSAHNNGLGPKKKGIWSIILFTLDVQVHPVEARVASELQQPLLMTLLGCSADLVSPVSIPYKPLLSRLAKSPSIQVGP